MQPRDGQRSLAHVDTGNVGASLGHALRQQATTAADIQSALSGQGNPLVDVVQPQGINIMQWLEFARGIPPAAGKGLEFGDLVPVYVLVCHGWFCLVNQ